MGLISHPRGEPRSELLAHRMQCLLFQKHGVSHKGDLVGVAKFRTPMLSLERINPPEWAWGLSEERGTDPVQVGSTPSNENTGAKFRAWRPGNRRGTSQPW